MGHTLPIAQHLNEKHQVMLWGFAAQALLFSWRIKNPSNAFKYALNFFGPKSLEMPQNPLKCLENSDWQNSLRQKWIENLHPPKLKNNVFFTFFFHSGPNAKSKTSVRRLQPLDRPGKCFKMPLKAPKMPQNGLILPFKKKMPGAASGVCHGQGGVVCGCLCVIMMQGVTKRHNCCSRPSSCHDRIKKAFTTERWARV